MPSSNWSNTTIACGFDFVFSVYAVVDSYEMSSWSAIFHEQPILNHLFVGTIEACCALFAGLRSLLEALLLATERHEAAVDALVRIVVPISMQPGPAVSGLDSNWCGTTFWTSRPAECLLMCRSRRWCYVSALAVHSRSSGFSERQDTQPSPSSASSALAACSD